MHRKFSAVFGARSLAVRRAHGSWFVARPVHGQAHGQAHALKLSTLKEDEEFARSLASEGCVCARCAAAPELPAGAHSHSARAAAPGKPMGDQKDEELDDEARTACCVCVSVLCVCVRVVSE